MADMSDRMGAYLDQREAIAERMLGWTCPCGSYGKGAVIPLAHQCPHALEAARQKAPGPAGGGVETAQGSSATEQSRKFTRSEVSTIIKSHKARYCQTNVPLTHVLDELAAIFERME